MELVKAFFDGYTTGELMNMVVLFMLFVIPNVGVRVINYFKNAFKLSAEKAQFFFLMSLAGISIAFMFVTGQITEVNFTLKTILSTFIAALVPAKFAYKRLMKKEEGK